MWFYYRLLVSPTDQSDSLHWPFISIFSILFQHVINWSLHSVSSEIQYIMFRLVYLLLCLFSYVLFQLYSILHAQYLSSTNAYVRYIFSWCRFRFSTSRSHIDRFSISSSADSVVSPHFPRTTVKNVISVFSHLVSVFARFSWGLSQYF